MKSLKLLLRFAVVGGLVILLMLPLMLIRGTINERETYRDQATRNVAQSTAGAQQVLGPLRAVPWVETEEVEFTDDKGLLRRRVEKREGTLLQPPVQLDVSGELLPETRRLGLFKVRVYRWQGQVSANYENQLPAASGKGVREYGQPYLVLGLSDVRGLIGSPALSYDGATAKFEPGTRAFKERFNGVNAPLPAINPLTPTSRAQLKLALAGTESLSVVPIGDDNKIALSSKWPHPSFLGDFLPSQRLVKPDGSGFDASWEISSLASKSQSQLASPNTSAEHIESLRVSLVDPVDVYTLADRASKYGILFVVLTFVGFALFELIKRLPIHPLQYLLVGLALAVFFLLLLSLSEHIPFWQAYLVSAAACIGLQFVYLSGVLKSWLRAGGFAVMLTALYGVLYGLLVSEDNALLMGSLLLFGILAAIMWITRKVDWYELGTSLR